MSIKTCCAGGSLHTGVPTGEIVQHHGLRTYVARASGQPKGVVVIIPDAFGIALLNNRILADEYAKKGNFNVYLPDFMNGYVLPISVMARVKALSAKGFLAQIYKVWHLAVLVSYFVPWLWNVRRSSAYPKITNYLEALRQNEASDLPIGVAGFCWGGLYVTELCWNRVKADDGARLVDCGFTAHPSMLTYPKSIENITLPISIAASEIDPQMSREQAKQTEDILKAKNAKTKDLGIEHEFVDYMGAHHGFAVRADEDDLHEAEAGKKAEAQAISWFSRWFANPPPS